jgi:hypothetical protein
MKNRILSVILAAVMLAAAIPNLTTNASLEDGAFPFSVDYTYGDFEFRAHYYNETGFGNLVFRGTIELTRYTGNDAHVTIPDLSLLQRAYAQMTANVVYDDYAGSLYRSKELTAGPNIGDRAFANNVNVVSVSIPASTGQIRNGAFAGCLNLTAINVAPENERFSSIDGVLLNRNQTTILLYPAGKSGSSYTIPDSVTRIDTSAFSRSGLTSTTIPDSVTQISDSAFRGSANLESVTLSDNADIAANAFTATPWFNNLPDGVIYLGANAVAWRGRMPENTAVVLREGTRRIIGGVFDRQPNLVSISIPSSLTQIDRTSVTSTSDLAFFAGSTGLAEFIVAEENPAFTSIDGVLFNKAGTQLVRYPAGNPRTSYTIPANVTSLSPNSFLSSVHLETLIFDSDVTVSARAGERAGFNGIATAVFTDNVTRIAANLFAGGNLTAVVIGENVTAVGNSAFANTNLRRVVISDSVITIGERAFFECRNLMSLRIGQSVTTIGREAFARTNIRNVVIPNSVTSIGNSAFENGWAAVNSVTIGNGLTSVGSRVFLGLPGVHEVTLAEGLTVIGETMFYNGRLTSIVLPQSLTGISRAAFAQTRLETVTIPAAVTAIGSEAFARITTLESVTFMSATPPRLTGGVFAGCRKLETIYVPVGAYEAYRALAQFNGLDIVEIDVSEIEIPPPFVLPDPCGCGQCADCDPFGFGWSFDADSGTLTFSTDDAITFWRPEFHNIRVQDVNALVIEGESTTVPAAKFRNFTALSSVVLSDSVAIIGERAFMGCTALTDVVLSDSVAIISERAFMGCTALANVVLPDSVVKLEEFAFAECANLSSVTIGSGVAKIGSEAFARSPLLAEITIPANVRYIGRAAIPNSYIIVDPANEWFSSIDGVLFNADYTVILQYPADREGDYTIPDTVTEIGDDAFARSLLESIVISDSVTEIGVGAFEFSRNLTSAVIGSGVTIIRQWAFALTGLKSIEFRSETPPESVAGGAFAGFSSAMIVYVPLGARETYRENAVLGRFRIVEICDSCGECEVCNLPAACDCGCCEICDSCGECEVCDPPAVCDCRNCDDCGYLGGRFGFGNVTGGNEPSVQDALQILRYIVGLDSPIADCDAARAAANITNPRAVSPGVQDALAILRRLVGLSSALD